MRIAYLSLHWPRPKDSGVGRKMLQQISSWRAAGHEVGVFVHTHPYPDTDELIEGERFEYQIYAGALGEIRTEISRSAAAQNLIAEVVRFRPDIIYLRWSMYVFPTHALFSIAPVIVEINTNDVYQHRLMGGLYGLYNQFTRGIFLGQAKGLICVSNELAVAPEFSRFHKPIRVITNGFDLATVKPLPAPNNEKPRLAFIGTPDWPWNGVDKLARLAQDHPDLWVDVIGYDRSNLGVEGELPENLVLHGYLKAEAYERVLATADASIGTLALHRKAMEEASPLKTRECLAYGLPMVLPYLDTDLDDLDSAFLLKIPNREDNIQTHGQAIRDFVYRMRGQRVERALIAPRIEAHLKEAERLDFFAQIRRGRR